MLNSLMMFFMFGKLGLDYTQRCPQDLDTEPPSIAQWLLVSGVTILAVIVSIMAIKLAPSGVFTTKKREYLCTNQRQENRCSCCCQLYTPANSNASQSQGIGVTLDVTPHRVFWALVRASKWCIL